MAVPAADPHPPTVAPNENLIVDGVPPVPAEIAEKAGRYGESRAAIFADWHPDGREMLILTRFGDTNQVHLVKDPGGARTQLTFFPDRVEGAQFDPIHGEYVVLHKGAGGAEFYPELPLRLQRRRDHAADRRQVAQQQHGLQPRRHARRLHQHAAQRRRHGPLLQFPLDPKTDRLLREMKGGGWEVLDWSPDGKTLLVKEEISITESHLWRVDAQSGKMTALLRCRGGRRTGRVRAGALFPRRPRRFSDRATKARSFWG